MDAEHPLQNSMMSQGLHTIRHLRLQYRSILATQINYKVVARSGSKEIVADAQALLHAVAERQCWLHVVQLAQKALHVQEKNILDAERGSEESLGAFAIVLSAIQARQSTCLQLHSELSGCVFESLQRCHVW